MVGADILTLFVILVGIFSLPSLMMYTCMCNWVTMLYSRKKIRYWGNKINKRIRKENWGFGNECGVVGGITLAQWCEKTFLWGLGTRLKSSNRKLWTRVKSKNGLIHIIN